MKNKNLKQFGKKNFKKITCSGSTALYLTAGDKISVVVYHNRGSATAMHNNAAYNHMEIDRIA